MSCQESRARRSGSQVVCSTPSRAGAAWSMKGVKGGLKTSPRDTSVGTRRPTPTSRTGCASRPSRLITCMSPLRLCAGTARGSARGSALLESVRVVQQAQQNRRRTTTSTRTWRRDKPSGTRPRTCCAGAGSSAARTTPSTRPSTTSGRVGGACGCRRGRKEEFCSRFSCPGRVERWSSRTSSRAASGTAILRETTPSAAARRMTHSITSRD